MTDRLRLGISACLLGEPVRWDGGHKRDRFLVDTLSRHVEWVPFCPEVDAGFGTPREPIRLVSSAAGVIATTRSGDDVTAPLARAAARLMRQAESADLSGFVLKSKSPSCGLERVKIYAPRGTSSTPGRGLFASALAARLPLLPVEEEGRLSDPRLRENFVERIFAYRRLRELFDGRWTVGGLVRFHTAHKLTLMAHSPVAYRRLGRFVAGAAARPRAEVRAEYERGFMDALAVVATPKKHADVLSHMLGYFKTSLDADARGELASTIEDYRLERVPLVVPLTLFRHHVRRVGVPYLAGQVYLDPHPRELALRNHV